MKDELDAHAKNRTWTCVPRTPDMHVIGSKWVYKIKRDASGNISKYKARVVAKGFSQQYGIDYTDTFSPVLKYKSLQTHTGIIYTYDNKNETVRCQDSIPECTCDRDHLCGTA